MRFILRAEPYGQGYRLDLVEPPNEQGVIAVAEPVTMKCIARDEIRGDRPGMLFLDNWSAGGQSPLQSLMDELWREGFRPKDVGTAGHLAATQEHLKDMRAIVAKQLDVKL